MNILTKIRYLITQKISYTRMIALGFLLIILFGTILLCLPISSREHVYTPFLSSAFTATSATCVTGLVVYDTYTHWSLFGQIVILCMIQIGGLGVMTVITTLSMFTKRKIGLKERKLLMESAGTIRLSGVIKMIRRVVAGTFIFELSGAAVLAVRFIPLLQSVPKGIYYAVFHSVSAFCNAGFDLMGRFEEFSSFTDFYGDPLINIPLILLISIGGIGFLVWSNLIQKKFRFKSLDLHSKIVLTSSAVLLILSWIALFFTEYHTSTEGFSFGEKLLTSLFCAVTPRTAGFNTVNLNSMSEAGRLITIVLMFIGGSPGSTAGGIKTTTIAVLLLSAYASSKHLPHVTVFKRRLEDEAIKRASSIFTIYTVFVLIATVIITSIERVPLTTVLFTCVSAAGTVGLGIYPLAGFSVTSQLILMGLMFAGRVGGLSIMLVLTEKRSTAMLERPTEKILIG